MDYSHRRDWILCREKQLAALFAIDVEFHTELSNHLHRVLRSGSLVGGLCVDLNIIKAGEATSLETARYSPLFQRMQAQRQPASVRRQADGWLGELTLRAETREDTTLGRSSRTGRRASDLGLIPISLEDYIKLARWTAQAWRSGEPKTIPPDLEAVLEGLDIRGAAWQQALEDYEQEFCHAVGPPSTLAEVAARLKEHHIKGMAASRRLFRESSSTHATG